MSSARPLTASQREEAYRYQDMDRTGRVRRLTPRQRRRMWKKRNRAIAASLRGIAV